MFIIAYHLLLFLFHDHSSNYNIIAVIINTKVPDGTFPKMIKI
jgi:hypothetical protein